MYERGGSPAADPDGWRSDRVSERFEGLVLCHFDLVYRVAFKLTHNVHDAEDLTQATMLRAHEAFGEFELREYGTKAWLLKILFNLHRSRRGHPQSSASVADDLSVEDFASELSREELPSIAAGQLNWEGFDEEIKTAVESLSPDHRAVLLLWALGDLSYKEIAHIMDCAIGTVMSRLHRARQQLNQLLAEYAGRHRLSRSPRPNENEL